MHIVVLITASSAAEARRIAALLVEKKLAACVNVVSAVTSLFRWKGKIDRAQEALLIVKTKKTRFPSLVKAVKAVHSYECPEIIALPIIAGEKQYLDWINASLKRSA